MSGTALLLLLSAADLETPGEEVARELREALARGDAAVARPLLEEAGEIARWPASPKEARGLVDLLAEASKSKDPAVAAAAVRALGRSGHEAAAAPLLELLAPQNPAGDAETLAIVAVQAAGRLRAAPLLAPLARLATKCESANVAAQALLALGDYSLAAPDLRREATAKALEAAQSIERAGRDRWRRLRGPSLRALQRLAGRKLNSLSQFEAFLKE
jgi:HEAT repeat protein